MPTDSPGVPNHAMPDRSASQAPRRGPAIVPMPPTRVIMTTRLEIVLWTSISVAKPDTTVCGANPPDQRTPLVRFCTTDRRER